MAYDRLHLYVVRSSNVANDERFFIDVYDYGKFLVELISGESTSCFQKQGKDSGKTLIEWVRCLDSGPSLLIVRFQMNFKATH